MAEGRASDFVASKGKPFSGFGFSGHCPFFDPTDVEEDSRTTKPSAIFRKSAKTINKRLRGDIVQLAVHTLRESLITFNDLSFVPETATKTSQPLGKDRTVQHHHLAEIGLMFFSKQLICCTDTKLSALHCSEGIVTSSSAPDGYFEDSCGHLRGIFEVKHGASTPAEALRQAAAEATNVAIRQLKLGVNATDIVVPVVGSNGYLIQFGAVIMLLPSFPTFIVFTHVLDLTKKASLTKAARMLCCIKIWVAKKLVFTQPKITCKPSIELSSSQYHCKKLNDFYKSTGSMQSSLYNFFEVMAHLHKNAVCRKHVVFPICVREYENKVKKSAIVFPKLDTSYKIGLPDTPELRTAFMNEVRRIIAAFHEAGLVHLDLYLSNIMWREVAGQVQLKIIDWDSAHFIDRGLSARTVKRLKYTLRRDKVRNKAAKDDHVDQTNPEMLLKLYDISLLRVFEKYIDEPDLRARVKNELDEACVQFQLKYVESSDDGADEVNADYQEEEEDEDSDEEESDDDDEEESDDDGEEDSDDDGEENSDDDGEEDSDDDDEENSDDDDEEGGDDEEDGDEEEEDDGDEEDVEDDVERILMHTEQPQRSSSSSSSSSNTNADSVNPHETTATRKRKRSGSDERRKILSGPPNP